MFDELIFLLLNPSFEFVLESIAVLTAIIYVILAAKGSHWCFLYGLISSAIYLYICLNYQLYFDVGLNVFYIIMSFYGWINWKSNTNSGELQISYSKRKTLGVLIVLGVLVNVLLAEFATRFSEASLPYFDAFTTIFALIGTYLVIQRKIENWLIWIAVDFVATGMYYYKELYLTSILFLVYTVIAVFGYISWKKQVEID